MKRLTQGQRVIVRACGDHESIPLPGNPAGTVVRLRRQDYGAWIRLDARTDVEDAHPFPADDDRWCNVLAYPEDCEPAPAPERP